MRNKNMKPIEKYRQKFLDLLKEAEEELGGDLCIRVQSSTKEVPTEYTCLPTVTKTKKEYHFSIQYNEGFLL